MNAELLSAKDKGRTEKGAAATGLARLIVVVAMLTFGALTAQAVTPKLTVAGSLTLLENLTTNALTNLTITVSDADTNVALSNLTLTASSSNTNLVADSGLVLSGSGASWTLTITPMQYAFGTAKISLVASDSQPASTTNVINLTVSLVEQPPSFALSTNVVAVSEETPSVTQTSFVTNISTGPSSQSGQSYKFIATTAVGAATNAVFTTLPAVSTNGTLTFKPKAHSYGTNLVTLVMLDNASTANGGVNAYTNTFLLEIVQTNHAPNILKLNNVTLLENSTNTVTVSVSVWDYDQNASNCLLTATTSDTNLASVAVTGTNVNAASNTNVTFTVTLTLTTNEYGVTTNEFVATEDGFSTTNSFKLTVTHVNKAPSFSFNTNVVISNVFTSEEEILAVTNAGFVTNMSAGPADESSQTWKFTVTTAGKQSTNAVFTTAPAISTNGTLTFKPKAHSYGTNLVTVVMTDNGGTANHGVNSCTNSFLLAIVQTNHAPTIVKVPNQTILENATNLLLSINAWDYDQNSSNCTLTATSSNTNLANISVSTNVGYPHLTNAIFPVTITLVSNQFGVLTNTLVATENGLSVTNTFTLTVTHVNQAPSFAFNTNVVVSNIFSSEEEILSVTNAGFLTNISVGPTNESTQTWKFAVVTETKGSNIAAFTTLPAISTNGTLTFKPKLHSYGTNLVTVIMTDNGGTANHGVDIYSNTFKLAIVQTNHAPTFSFITNLTVLENKTNITTSLNVWDYDQQSSNCTLTVTSLNTNLETASVSTNVSRPTVTNAVFTLAVTLVSNQFGVVTNQLVATEDGLSTTNTLVVTVTHVNQAPSFTFNTNVVVSNKFSSEEETLAVTNVGFLTNLLAGPTNENTQTWVFTVTTPTNQSTNATFTKLPAIATNGTLTFNPAAHSYGTNLVTVVMTDNGGTANGGINTFTNTFLLAIVQTNHAPVIVPANITVLENATNFTVPVTVWDYDKLNSNFVLTATSSYTNLETVTVGTNAVLSNLTNAVYTLTFALGTNQFGVVTNQLIATEGALSSTNNLVVTINHVNQPPSFTFDSNAVVSNILVVAENTGVTNLAGFLTNLSAGPTNQSNETWSFSLHTATNGGTNAAFTQLTAATNGTLTLDAATNSFGTNLVTVVMTTSGGTSNGGLNSYTNSFYLQVTQILYPPEFTGITNKTILENATTNLTLAFTLYNHLNTNFTVTAAASDTNLATVAVSGGGASNTLTFTPATNQNGSETITVTAVTGSLTNSTNLTLTVTPVNQPPSFDLAIPSITVDQYGVAVTVPSVVTNIQAGPTNESSQTVSFIVTNSSSNLFQSGGYPAIDTNGTLTFTPASQGGTVTLGIKAVDDGGTSNGGVNTSAVQTMTIVIPTNTFQGVTGQYAGLFYDTNTMGNESSGYVSLVLATNGTFTGYLLGAGDSNAFSGQFDISNTYASVTASTFTLDLTIDTSSNQAVGGSVSNSSGGWDVALQAYRAGYSASSHTSLAGTYLAALAGFDDPTAGPPGDSIFSITISNTGAVALSGTMADNTAVAQASQISLDGYYPLYVPLYSGGSAGSLIGWLDFNGNAASSLTTNSTLTWFSAAGASASYAAGFTNQGAPIASLYNSALTNLLGFTSGSVILSGGDLQTNLTNSVTVSGNVITVTPATNGLNLSIVTGTGEIQGSFVDPNSSLTNSFHAAILQGTNFAPGFFLGTDQGGSFILIGN